MANDRQGQQRQTTVRLPHEKDLAAKTRTAAGVPGAPAVNGSAEQMAEAAPGLKPSVGATWLIGRSSLFEPVRAVPGAVWVTLQGRLQSDLA